MLAEGVTVTLPPLPSRLLQRLAPWTPLAPKMGGEGEAGGAEEEQEGRDGKRWRPVIVTRHPGKEADTVLMCRQLRRLQAGGAGSRRAEGRQTSLQTMEAANHATFAWTRPLTAGCSNRLECTVLSSSGI